MQVDEESHTAEYEALLQQCTVDCELAESDAWSFRELCRHLGERQGAAAALICAWPYILLLRIIDLEVSGAQPAKLAKSLGIAQRQLPRELQLPAGSLTSAACQRIAAAAKGFYADGKPLPALYLWRAAFQRLQAWHAGPELADGLLQRCASNFAVGVSKVRVRGQVCTRGFCAALCCLRPQQLRCFAHGRILQP